MKSRLLSVLLLVPILASGCVTPTQEVTTVWQKLGVPQAVVGLRDHLTNPLGNNPQRERKPPRLRIADAAQLDPENPALAAAAKIKQAEDIAPAKIKALKYLGEVGCGCYADMEAAFMSGLQDCTPSVRMAAIEAIGTALSKCGLEEQIKKERCKLCGGQGCTLCKNKKEKNKLTKITKHKKKTAERQLKAKERRQNCRLCLGRGCQNCEEPSDCCSCNPYSCCSKAIQDKLKDMAVGMDEYGCFKEPVAEIRAAAEAMMCLCPPLPEPMDVDVPQPGEDSPDGEGTTPADPGSDTITAKETESILHAVPVIQAEQPKPISSSSAHFNQTLFDQSQVIPPQEMLDVEPVTIQRSIEAEDVLPPIVSSEAVGDGMLPCKISGVDRFLFQVDLTFDDDYLIPVGSSIIVQMDGGEAFEMTVATTSSARLTARYEDESAQVLSPGATARVGIVSVHRN